MSQASAFNKGFSIHQNIILSKGKNYQIHKVTRHASRDSAQWKSRVQVSVW